RETEIEIPEAASCRDRANVDTISELCHRFFEVIEDRADLVELRAGPGIPSKRFRSNSGLVPGKKSRIEKAIRERLLGQRLPPNVPRPKEATLAKRIEILADDPAVIEHAT